MKIYLAADHAGFELKEKIKTFLAGNGYEVEDFGAHEIDPEDDYPDFVRKAAEAVAKCELGSPSAHSTIAQGGEFYRTMSSGQKLCRGIIFGGSGQGEAMVANRVRSVRAAVFYGGDENIIKLSREHNDANVLSLGARFLSEADALRAVELWLKTPFSSEPRHKRRIDKF